MANWFVATTGSDSNSGTAIGSEFLTVAHACAQLNAGDTLFIRTGVYSGASNRIWSADFTHTGTAWTVGNYITIKPYNFESVTLYNTGSGFADSTVHHVYIEQINFDTAIDQCFYTADDSHHIRLNACTIKNGTANSGVGGFGWGMGGSYHECLACYVHDNGVGGNDATDGHGIYTSGDHCLIEDCRVYSNYGYGIHVVSGGTGTSYNTVRRNKVYSNGHAGNVSAGIIISHGTGNLAYDNIIYNNNYDGLWIYSNATDNKALNNTIYGNGHDAIRLEFYANAPTVRNNIIWGNTNDVITDAGGTGSPVTDHNITTDPGYVDAAGGDFHLSSTGSSAYHAGVDVSGDGVTTDYDGVTFASPPSCGAFEFASETTTFTPDAVAATWVVPSPMVTLVGGTPTAAPTAIPLLDALAGVARAGISRAGFFS